MPSPIYEEVIEPDLEICDAHHHLWDMPLIAATPFFAHLSDGRYLLPELLEDLGQGHNISRTVYLEVHSFYRADGPPDMASVGEVEFANGMAAMGASGRYGGARPCAGIVSRVDLMLGDRLDAVLAAHKIAGGGRLKGVRNIVAHDPAGFVEAAAGTRDGQLYRHPDFRRGFARLRDHGLSFDAWCYHPQIPEVIDLARSFPEQPIVLDHLGTPIGIGGYASQRGEVFAAWKAAMADLAGCPNVSVKLGGLGMFMLGFDLPDRRAVPSAVLADAWRPYIETCIELFGVDRCMFESNVPVDAACGYGILWNAFKRIASGCSVDEKSRLFSGTAVAFYGL